MYYKIAAAVVVRLASPKVVQEVGGDYKQEFFYMKLYMDGYNIDVQ